MAPLSSPGQLLARSISHGAIAGATVGAFIGALFVFILLLPFILRAFREARFRRRISSDNAEMGYAGAAPAAYSYSADREINPAPTLHATTLPPGTQPAGYTGYPDMQAPTTAYYPSGASPGGPTTALGDSGSYEAVKDQNGLPSPAPSLPPLQMTTAGFATAEPGAAEPGEAASTSAAADGQTSAPTLVAPTSEAAAAAEAEAAATTSTAATAEAEAAATTSTAATPAEPAPAKVADGASEVATPTEPAVLAAPEASEASGAPGTPVALPASSSSTSDGQTATLSHAARAPVLPPINTIVAQDAATSTSASLLRTPPPLARGAAATFPSFPTQPQAPFQPRKRSATSRSGPARRPRSLLDRAAGLFRSNSSRPAVGTRGLDQSRSPVVMGFRNIEGPDHHSWLMTEQGVRIEPEFPGISIFEVDLNNLSGASAEYYSEEPLSPPTDQASYIMFPTSYASTPPSMLASSLAGMATAGALVGVAAGTDEQPGGEHVPETQTGSLQPGNMAQAKDKAKAGVSPLPPSPISPPPFTQTTFIPAPGDRVDRMEDLKEEPYEGSQDDPASRKGSASTISATAACGQGELSPETVDYMRSPSYPSLVPSPRLPAPGTVNPRDVWAPATDDERFVHKTAELDRIEQSPPAAPLEVAAGVGATPEATSSPSAHDSDGDRMDSVSGASGISGTSGTTSTSGMGSGMADDEIDPIVVPDGSRESTEVTEPSEPDTQLVPELQVKTAPTPPEHSIYMPPVLQLQTMPMPGSQPTFQVTTPENYESPESGMAPMNYSHMGTLADDMMGAHSGYDSHAPAQASVHAPVHAPMHVPTHGAPTHANVSAPIAAHNQSYAPAFINNNYQHMLPQNFTVDFNLNYNAAANQSNYMVDNMFPSLPTNTDKVSNFGMVQQANDMAAYWSMPAGLPMIAESYAPPVSHVSQRPTPPLYYPGPLGPSNSGMLYHPSGSNGGPQPFTFQTPQSSPGHASIGFSEDSSVQMQSLPSTASSSSAPAVVKQTSPPATSLSVPGSDLAARPLSPMSNQGSTPGQSSISSPRSFICDECNRSFDQIHKLNHHKRYHERPHECTVAGCGKRFGTKTHLGRHFNDKHSKSRKYHCTEEGCPYSVVGGKSFPRKDNWRRHMVNKHGVQPEHEPIEVVDEPMMELPE